MILNEKEEPDTKQLPATISRNQTHHTFLPPPFPQTPSFLSQTPETSCIVPSCSIQDIQHAPIPAETSSYSLTPPPNHSWHFHGLAMPPPRRPKRGDIHGSLTECEAGTRTPKDGPQTNGRTSDPTALLVRRRRRPRNLLPPIALPKVDGLDNVPAPLVLVRKQNLQRNPVSITVRAATPPRK